MTSYDRHASHDSPYRTGQHMPLNQSRHTPLTSIATSALDSRADLSSPYEDGPVSGRNGWTGSPGPVQSPNSPYSPGMRSSLVMGRKGSQDNNNNGGNNAESMMPGEIQMQSFQEGLPPPPPVSHSWKRIDRWVEDNYPELYDQLSEGCTQNDLNELEHELDCSLPIEVRESLQCHDGQERGGRPCGIVSDPLPKSQAPYTNSCTCSSCFQICFLMQKKWFKNGKTGEPLMRNFCNHHRATESSLQKHSHLRRLRP